MLYKYYNCMGLFIVLTVNITRDNTHKQSVNIVPAASCHSVCTKESMD